MKINKYIASLGLSILILFSSCGSDFLDVTPTETITEDDVAKIGDMQPLVTGLYSSLIAYNTLNRTAVRHSDFGHFSIVLASDLMVDDMMQYTANYGWYYNHYDLSLRDDFAHVDNELPWLLYYKLIKSSNDILNKIEGGDDIEEEAKLFRGQAYGMRAFAYYNLVNLYGTPYGIDKTAAGVPIIIETTPVEELKLNPRAEVQKVYELILADLGQAEKDLAMMKRPSKDVMNIRVVYGLLARTYLMMEDGAKAAEYAAKARKDYKLMDKSDLYWSETKTASFSDIANQEWMWGCDVTVDSRIATSGIVNFTSHISSLTYGYVTAGNMDKCIDADLYNNIPSTDARKKAFLEDEKKLYGRVVPKYANIKFGRLNPSTDVHNDYPLMRAAEMYLIEAEGYARSNNPTKAQDILFDFVSQRDAGYTKSTKTGDALIDEIYFQRRIELWGEGFSYFDHKRLNKGVVRDYEGTNHNADAKKNYPAGDKIFKFRIPQNEITYNKGIPSSANND